jgi:hypothetical protein
MSLRCQETSLGPRSICASFLPQHGQEDSTIYKVNMACSVFIPLAAGREISLCVLFGIVVAIATSKSSKVFHTDRGL